jgi:hypothetical protein
MEFASSVYHILPYYFVSISYRRIYGCIDQIPAEPIKAGGRTIRCAIHKLIIAIWNREGTARRLEGVNQSTYP